ncbi:LOW QUALITY PROTEIN: cation transporter HKT1;3 [Spinacia oleracea]|uniref:LOW QUALITY PROTEIN: cation transporter HKT13 n=1 Tax=Spinacia oleracea TaxID=3562 RepID=A0A9R0KA64_SPIOL|nr:LOW QUALITY PROTEIN: cation transporter HKT1;3 [Spinacia oleracea]
MNYFSSLGNKVSVTHLCKHYFPKKSSNSLMKTKTSMFHYVISHAKPFWLHLFYFLVVSLVGYMVLKVNNNLNNLDLFFTSVSATTASSMSTLEMEVFSNDQLIVMTILMLLGGEVFTSMLGLQLRRCNFSSFQTPKVDNSHVIIDNNSIELGTINQLSISTSDDSESYSKYYNNSIKVLGYVVLGYLLVVHAIGSTLVTIYMTLTPSANNVLKSKGLVLNTFSFFVIVSTFSSCGFIPTNENMIIFRGNPGLLLIVLPFVFLGNTLYPSLLRLVIWVLERFIKKKEFNYMLNNYKEMGYDHLLSSKECWYLTGTTIAFLVLQVVVFCAMEWSSGVMEGMNSYQKFVGSVFQTANTRHSGESIVDLSLVSPAILVLFIIMMYLPAYTSFLPISDEQEETPEKSIKMKKKKKVVENMVLSQLSYLVIFVIIICITERKSLKDDPLNFNVLNIVFEVISAYGNVGLSTGYNCKRRLNSDKNCSDKLYGFSGRWSNAGKCVLILVMFFGRLKKFNMHGGKSWKML